MTLIPQTDLSEWGSDGLLKDPVGVYTHRDPVPPSTFVRRLRDTCCRLVYAKWSLMPLWLKKHSDFDTLCLPDTSRGQKSIFGKNIHMLGRECTLCFVTFQIHLSSQKFYLNDLGMTGPIFRVPDQNEFTRAEIWRIWTGFSCCRRTVFSVTQTYRNFLCGEQQPSLSPRHREILLV